METTPTSLTDGSGVAYIVEYLPPRKPSYLSRVEVRDCHQDLVAEMEFGERSPGYFYLADLQVYQGQRRGIGSQLLSIAEAFAKNHGFSEVHGTIIAYAPESADCSYLKNWYRKRGYAITFRDGHPRKEYCGDISKRV